MGDHEDTKVMSRSGTSDPEIGTNGAGTCPGTSPSGEVPPVPGQRGPGPGTLACGTSPEGSGVSRPSGVPLRPLYIGFSLPWPPARLSPNARPHWAERARLAKAYRRACAAQATQALDKASEARLRAARARGEDVHVELRFVPPDRRGRDQDNALAAIKSGLDGVADALGVNDRQFRIRPVFETDRVAGIVFVTVSIE